jgi:hypothetical protein
MQRGVGKHEVGLARKRAGGGNGRRPVAGPAHGGVGAVEDRHPRQAAGRRVGQAQRKRLRCHWRGGGGTRVLPPPLHVFKQPGAAVGAGMRRRRRRRGRQQHLARALLRDEGKHGVELRHQQRRLPQGAVGIAAMVAPSQQRGPQPKKNRSFSPRGSERSGARSRGTRARPPPCPRRRRRRGGRRGRLRRPAACRAAPAAPLAAAWPGKTWTSSPATRR